MAPRVDPRQLRWGGTQRCTRGVDQDGRRNRDGHAPTWRASVVEEGQRQVEGGGYHDGGTRPKEPHVVAPPVSAQQVEGAQDRYLPASQRSQPDTFSRNQQRRSGTVQGWQSSTYHMCSSTQLHFRPFIVRQSVSLNAPSQGSASTAAASGIRAVCTM